MRVRDNLYLTYDPLNEVVFSENNCKWVVLLGMVMDTVDFHMNAKVVADKLLSLYSISENAMLDYVDDLNGRFFIMYGEQNSAYLIQDTVATRTVCYAQDALLVASHYNIINDIINDEPHPFLAKYMSLSPRPWILPGR